MTSEEFKLIKTIETWVDIADNHLASVEIAARDYRGDLLGSNNFQFTAAGSELITLLDEIKDEAHFIRVKLSKVIPLLDSDTQNIVKGILDELEKKLNLQFWTEDGNTDIIHNGAVTMALDIVKDLKKKHGVDE